jgi:3-hydroxyacyl-CoA dehydrogenase
VRKRRSESEATMASGKGASEESDRVAVITLTAPPLNPLSFGVRKALLDQLHAAEQDPSVAMIVITGTGNNFSAGADIKEMADFSAAEGVNSEPTLPPVVEAIEACSKPVVAAIDGVALGGGCEVALACHYRVATPRAKLGLPEVKIGLIPGAGGTQRLPRLVDIATALKVITLGPMVKAPDALAAGLLDAVVPKAEKDLIAAAVAFVAKQADFTPGAATDARRTGKRPTRSSASEIRDACAKAAAKVGPPVSGNEPVWSAIQVCIHCTYDANCCGHSTMNTVRFL